MCFHITNHISLIPCLFFEHKVTFGHTKEAHYIYYVNTVFPRSVAAATINFVFSLPPATIQTSAQSQLDRRYLENFKDTRVLSILNARDFLMF